MSGTENREQVNIPHDAQIFNKVVITSICTLAGITNVLDGANHAMVFAIKGESFRRRRLETVSLRTTAPSPVAHVDMKEEG